MSGGFFFLFFSVILKKKIPFFSHLFPSSPLPPSSHLLSPDNPSSLSHLLASLSLEGIDICSQSLSSSSLRSSFPSLLYPLFALSSHPCGAVRGSGWACVVRVGREGGYGGGKKGEEGGEEGGEVGGREVVERMVRENSDYFLDCFSQRMRFIESYPETPLVCCCCWCYLLLGVGVGVECLKNNVGKTKQIKLNQTIPYYR